MPSESQIASASPSAPKGSFVPISHSANAPTASAAIPAPARRESAGAISPRFHPKNGPTAMTAIIGATIGMNTALKKGGPTEIFPAPIASMNSG